ncbi:hypothetical protein [Sneathiella chinensis]|uniref:Uncharacterized protein n=1 Tax=Sneathiella chinensis TaxID=349750 RepID=A0ABQ5U6F9_9PROT|nr:hypothetical protein [Sneathiella chinensis]GLQ07702.1 hypothetical protein GCM10007924_29230 [Sneathiella chinensis]
MLAEKDDLERALRYPYTRPEGSFLLDRGECHPLPASLDFRNRIPVLASGSNAAPEQLMRKFPKEGNFAPVFVTAAQLQGFCCVYSAHFSGYGAVPATLHPSQTGGTRCHITWLTPDQLSRMHETEAVGKNYRYSRLERLSLTCDVTGRLEMAHAYISRFGALAPDGTPVALAELPGDRGDFSALTQRQIQEKIKTTLAPDTELGDFIRENILSAPIREQRTEKMGPISLPFSYSFETVLQGHQEP